MWQTERRTTPIARKDYYCQASGCLTDDCFTADELTIVAKAREEKFKILKGTKYLHIRGLWEGKYESFRARLDINEICIKYNLYDE